MALALVDPCCLPFCSFSRRSCHTDLLLFVVCLTTTGAVSFQLWEVPCWCWRHVSMTSRVVPAISVTIALSSRKRLLRRLDFNVGTFDDSCWNSYEGFCRDGLLLRRLVSNCSNSSLSRTTAVVASQHHHIQDSRYWPQLGQVYWGFLWRVLLMRSERSCLIVWLQCSWPCQSWARMISITASACVKSTRPFKKHVW